MQLITCRRKNRKKSKLQFGFYCAMHFSLPLLAILAVFSHNVFVAIFVTVSILTIGFMWPKCTNCGLLYSAGEPLGEKKIDLNKTDIEATYDYYGPRFFPGRCSRCDQDHWHPFAERIDDWKSS
jgi:hypothetical protein